MPILTRRQHRLNSGPEATGAVRRRTRSPSPDPRDPGPPDFPAGSPPPWASPAVAAAAVAAFGLSAAPSPRSRSATPAALDPLQEIGLRGVDGMTRAMTAYSLFNEAKVHYAACDEAGPSLEATHRLFAARCTELAESLGGLYVKAAQLVAALRGGAGELAIPRAYVEELARLTDRSAASPLSMVRGVIAAELGRGLQPDAAGATGLSGISAAPIAAGSIAQVHTATLAAGAWNRDGDGTGDGGLGSVGGGGRVVAVKVQHGYIAAQAAGDFDVFRVLGSMISLPGGHDIAWLVDDVEANIGRELDFRIEAGNSEAARLAVRASDIGDRVIVPAVLPGHTTSRTLVTEFIPGLVRLDDGAGLVENGIVGDEIAALLCRVFADLILGHGIVHGDPHLGNVYAVASAPTGRPGGQLVLLDWGLVHSLDDRDRLLLSELLVICATPLPATARIREITSELAGPLASLFPLLLSPAFALASDLPTAALLAAAESRLPDTVTADQIWRALEALRGHGPGLIGAMHCMGYVRGALGVLGYSERHRVLALALAGRAALGQSTLPEHRAYARVPPPVAGLLVRVHVWMLFVVLWLVQLAVAVGRRLLAFARWQ